jgi:predicted O-methyltransferase YrrM
MTPSNVLCEKPQLPARSLAREVRRAFASPLRAWEQLRRWTLLAKHAELPCAELLRYRRELTGDREFQEHLQRCRRDVHYIMPEAAELYAIVRAAKPLVVVETGVASGLSSAHILRALDRNGFGTLHSLDLPNVQEGSVLPDGRTSGWIVPESLRDRWKLQLGDTWVLLPELLQSLDRLDLFLHDSDHSYEAMLFEFEQAYPKLEPGGLLLSDDTHLHAAWDDFCAKHSLRPGRVGHLGVTHKPE